MKQSPGKLILKCVVGSQAHGLANEASDTDYRGVFVLPTSEILSLGSKPQTTSWIEGDEDDTSWELSHFLRLSLQCNPTVLEAYLAPTVPVHIQDAAWGLQLRELFPYVWNRDGVKNAFIGYSMNQQKKMLDNKDNRRSKYAAAYLRTLVNAYELLSSGTFTIKVGDLEIGSTIKRFKEGNFTDGECIDICREWIEKIGVAYQSCQQTESQPDRLNDFLLKVRKENW